MGSTGEYTDEEEDILGFIGRELDEREEEARREHQQYCQQEQHEAVEHTCKELIDDTAANNEFHNDEVEFLEDGNDRAGFDENEIQCFSVDNVSQNQIDNNDDGAQNHEVMKGSAAKAVPRTTSKRRKEYSIIKSTTPRFSFRSSSEASQSPMGMHSNSSFEKQHSKKSAKRKHRHSFRPSIERKATNNDTSVSQVNTNMRELGFAPKFLVKTSGSIKDDTISSQLDEGEGDNNHRAHTKRKWNRLSSSHSLVISPNKQSQSGSGRRNKGGGYLIQNLRSLRSNDQRMAMRLRASSGGPLHGGAPSSSKRRRSGGSLIHVAATELDVTIMNAALPSQNLTISVVGGGELRICYIRRYTGSFDTELPCYSWIILPQHVMNEQAIGSGGEKEGFTHLRFYNAIIIPPRVASINGNRVNGSVPLSGLEERELPLPTIICTNVCEQCSHEIPSNFHPSFDLFISL